MKNILLKLFNMFFGLFRVKENKIIFQSSPDKIDGNPYALYKYIKENCPNDFEVRWLISKKTDIRYVEKKECTYIRTLRYYYDLATAKYWIRSHFNGSILKKKKNQIYLQLWHGWGNFKKCGYDIDNKIPIKDRKPMDTFKECSCYLAAEKYIASAMKTSIGYNNPIEIIGMGRTDELINLDKNKCNELRKQYGLPLDKKILLYAPTFRDNQISENDVELKIKKLSELNDWVVLVSFHPFVASKLEKIGLPSNFINVSHVDIFDSLIIADLLITDYSSSIFDYSILEKPMIFYMYDRKEYMKTRGFYLDYKKDLPGPIIEDEDELYNQVLHYDELKDKYHKRLKDFKKKYNYKNDGHVNERIVKLIKNGHFEKYVEK